MEYNKNQFLKSNDKKVLHKVRKHWVVMSTALLMMLGGAGFATHVSAHADTTNNNQKADQTNTLKEHLNTSLQKTNQGQQSKVPVNSNVNRNQSVSNQGRQITLNDIADQASVLHQRILENATSFKLGQTDYNTSGERTVINPNKVSQSNGYVTNSDWGMINGTYHPVTSANQTDSGSFSNGGHWTSYSDGSIYFQGNGCNWAGGGPRATFNLAPYQHVYISDVTLTGAGHMFYGYNGIRSFSFRKINNGLSFMDNDFAGDTSLQQINGLSDFMDNDPNLEDYDYMFKNCSSLKYLDLSGLDTRVVKKSGQGTYDSSDSYRGDGNHNAFYGMTSLSKVKLGSNTILYPSSKIPTVFVNEDNPNAGAAFLDDGYAHPGTWGVFQGQQGTWGTAQYILNADGAMLIDGTNGGANNGQITSNRNDASNLDWSKVKHIYTRNVTAPAGNLGGFSEFGGLPNL